MTNEEYFHCPHCAKRIQYERPHFCPFCGGSVDPSAGLTDEMAGPPQIYRWSTVAPFLMKVLMFTALLAFPVSFIFGRRGIFFLSILLALCVAVVLLVSLFVTRKTKPQD